MSTLDEQLYNAQKGPNVTKLCILYRYSTLFAKRLDCGRAYNTEENAYHFWRLECFRLLRARIVLSNGLCAYNNCKLSSGKRRLIWHKLAFTSSCTQKTVEYSPFAETFFYINFNLFSEVHNRHSNCILMFTSGKGKCLALGRMVAGAWTL